MSKPKIAVQFGIFTGKHTGKRLIKTLRSTGYNVVQDATKADIIIAHSAGCFWLPKAPTHQKLMLIDPPYWPGKTIGERAKSRSQSNMQFKSRGIITRDWLARNAWTFYYAFRHAKRTRQIFTLAKSFDLPVAITGHHVLLVRNNQDDWLTPDLDELQQANPNLIVKQLPGDHDDLLHNPEPYVDLLQSLV
jgi:hypothetical protein